MLRGIIVALIGLLAAVNGSKWFFDGKRLPTLVIDPAKLYRSALLFNNIYIAKNDNAV